MSMPSDVNPDVAEAVRTVEEKVPPEVRKRTGSLLRRVSPEQYGFAAAALVAFLGVAVCGPRVYAMRHPRRRPLPERTRRAAEDAARETRERARAARDEAARRLRRLGEGLPGAR